MKSNKIPTFLIYLTMFYVTCKLACNPMFFRQAEFTVPLIQYHMKITCAAFIFPAIYVISDAIIALTNRKIGGLIIIFGIICDGIFSYGISYFAKLEIPAIMSKTELLNTTSINIIAVQMWPLFYHGVIASAAAAIGEALIFSFIYKKLNNFFISTIASIIITLVIHNLITDYPILRDEPDAWHIIINNLLMNTSFMMVYTLIIVIFMRIHETLKLK